MDSIFYIDKERLIVKLIDEVDHHVAEKLRESIDNELEQNNILHLVLDFSGVTFMDSSGIGIVLGRYRKLNEKGGKVTIRNCNHIVKKIMEMSGIFQLMDYEGGRDGK